MRSSSSDCPSGWTDCTNSASTHHLHISTRSTYTRGMLRFHECDHLPQPGVDRQHQRQVRHVSGGEDHRHRPKFRVPHRVAPEVKRGVSRPVLRKGIERGVSWLWPKLQLPWDNRGRAADAWATLKVDMISNVAHASADLPRPGETSNGVQLRGSNLLRNPVGGHVPVRRLRERLGKRASAFWHTVEPCGGEGRRRPVRPPVRSARVKPYGAPRVDSAVGGKLALDTVTRLLVTVSG